MEQESKPNPNKLYLDVSKINENTSLFCCGINDINKRFYSSGPMWNVPSGYIRKTSYEDLKLILKLGAP
jgi:hypothetical protein